MIEAVFLDTTPLGLITGRQDRLEPQACRNWAANLLSSGVTLYVPEIADHEVRRELVRAGKAAGLIRLDAFHQLANYLPLTTGTMRLAAELWAQSRNAGVATSDPAALDGDVILAAQALMLALPESSFVVATSNVRHLKRFVPAQQWHDISLES